MIEVRRYGARGSLAIVLHGGPGARGEAAPLARALSDRYRVLEPLQRRAEAAGGSPLTVARHVEDLREVAAAEAGPAPSVVVGFSWGAMLALAFAAEHPAMVERLVLVGCGTFDLEARAELVRRRASCCGDEVDPDPAFDAPVDSDERGGADTWADMLRLQADGTYPASFARIAAPVVMIHGERDPHPGRMIRDGLSAHLRELSYLEIPACGHKPWVERAQRAKFFTLLSEALPRVA
jgi:pimeloyl-ACP methyl ester carboxylesterase